MRNTSETDSPPAGEKEHIHSGDVRLVGAAGEYTAPCKVKGGPLPASAVEARFSQCN